MTTLVCSANSLSFNFLHDVILLFVVANEPEVSPIGLGYVRVQE